MALEIPCIYCGTLFDPWSGEGDHVIPSQLGEFRNDIRFRGMCPSCNTEIGKLEQQITQSGPEGFWRGIVQPNSKRLQKRRIGIPRGALGAPAPETTVIKDGMEQIVRQCGSDPRNVKPVDHVRVYAKNGNVGDVHLYPQMRAEQVTKQMSELELDEMKTAEFHVADQHWPAYQTLFAAIWPNVKSETVSVTPAGATAASGKIRFVVGPPYWRALAKIAFHYYLLHTRRGFRGSEECFGRIRQFICCGGDSGEFFFPEYVKRFRMPFGEIGNGCLTPTTWGHVLVGTESRNMALVYLQLFVGPRCIPQAHCLKLADMDDCFSVPTSSWAHVYQYDAQQSDGRYAGEVHAQELILMSTPSR